PRPVAQVRLRVLAGVPHALDRVDLVHAGELVLVEANAVEDVELELGPPVAGVGDARRGQAGLRFLGHVTRVAGICLTCDRISDVAGQAAGGSPKHRVDEGRAGVGEQAQVALADLRAP